MARVSVLMPAYNAGRYIGAAIESILAQTYKDFEIIVVDDGSSDETGAVASSYPGVRYFKEPHRGISPTRNSALEKAQGELIAFLDADDLWTPDKLALQVEYLDSHPDCRIVFCRYRNFSDTPEEELDADQKKLIDTEISQYMAGACLRRNVYEQIGGFNTACAYGEDTEWTARMVMAGIDVSACIQKYLYLRRVHGANITLNHNAGSNEQFYSGLADSIRKQMMARRKAAAKKSE